MKSLAAQALASLVIAAAALPVVSAQEAYTVTDLGPIATPPTDGVARERTRAAGISRSGVVVGESTLGTQASSFPHATRWTRTNLQGVALVGNDPVTTADDQVVTVGVFGAVATSSNGGASWNQGTLGSQQSRHQAVAGNGRATDPRVVVGTRSAIYVGSSLTPSPILWSEIPVGTDVTPTLYAVSTHYSGAAPAGTDEYLAVAVGAGGAILVSENFGGSWVQSPIPRINGAAPTLYGVTVLTPDLAVAVGERGSILVYNRQAVDQDPDGDGSPWNPVTSGTSSTLFSVAGSVDTLVAVGASGLALTATYDSAALTVGSWAVMATGVDANLRSVDILRTGGGLQGYAVGSSGTLLELVAGAWQVQAAPAAAAGLPLRAVAITDAAGVQAVVVGEDGLSLRRSGGVWSSISVVGPETADLGTLDGSAATGGYLSRANAVNDQGVVVGESHISNTNRTITGFMTGQSGANQEGPRVVLADQDAVLGLMSLSAGSGGTRPTDDPSTTVYEPHAYDFRGHGALAGPGRALRVERSGSLAPAPNQGRQFSITGVHDWDGVAAETETIQVTPTPADTTDILRVRINSVVASGDNTFWESGTNLVGVPDDVIDGGDLVWIANGPNGNTASNPFNPYTVITHDDGTDTFNVDPHVPPVQQDAGPRDAIVFGGSFGFNTANIADIGGGSYRLQAPAGVTDLTGLGFVAPIFAANGNVQFIRVPSTSVAANQSPWFMVTLVQNGTEDDPATVPDESSPAFIEVTSAPAGFLAGLSNTGFGGTLALAPSSIATTVYNADWIGILGYNSGAGGTIAAVGDGGFVFPIGTDLSIFQLGDVVEVSGTTNANSGFYYTVTNRNGTSPSQNAVLFAGISNQSGVDVVVSKQSETVNLGIRALSAYGQSLPTFGSPAFTGAAAPLDTLTAPTGPVFWIAPGLGGARSLTGLGSSGAYSIRLQWDLDNTITPNETGGTAVGPFTVGEVSLNSATTPFIQWPTALAPNHEEAVIGVRSTGITAPSTISFAGTADISWIVPGMRLRLRGGGAGNDGAILDVESVVSTGPTPTIVVAQALQSGGAGFLNPYGSIVSSGAGRVDIGGTEFGVITVPVGTDLSGINPGDRVALTGNRFTSNQNAGQALAGEGAVRWQVVGVDPVGGAVAGVTGPSITVAIPVGITWTPALVGTFLDAPEVVTLIPGLNQVALAGTVRTTLQDVNEEGWVVGSAISGNPSDPLTVGVERALVVSPTDGGIDIGTLPGGQNSRANAISNRKERFRKRQVQTEEVVGWSNTSSGRNRAFVYRPRHLNDMDTVRESVGLYGGQPPLWPVSQTSQNGQTTIWNFHGVQHQTTRYSWAVGANGAILFSDNDGAPPVEQVSGTDKDLFAVDFVSPTAGVAVGEGGSVLFTIDGGVTWQPGLDETTGGPVTTKDLYGVDFVEGGPVGALSNINTYRALGQVVFAVGAGGTIIKSNDGGATWRRLESGTTQDLFAVSFPGHGYIPWDIARNPVHGWAVGDGVAIVTSSSGEPQDNTGGSTVPGWTRVEFPAQYRNRTLFAVASYTANHVMFAGEGGLIVRGQAAPGVTGGWSFPEIQDVGEDVYDLELFISNYAYNDGVQPAPGAVRTLGDPYPSIIAPTPGQWIGASHPSIPFFYSDGTARPEGLAVGADGRIFKYDYFTWNPAGSIANSIDLRGVSGVRFDMLFDTNDLNTIDEATEGTGPQYKSYHGEISGTDGAIFGAALGTDPLGSLQLVPGFDQFQFPNAINRPAEDGYLFGGLAGGDGQSGSAFAWGIRSRSNGRMIDLGSLYGSLGSSAANDITDDGTIVGESRPTASGTPHAFLLRKRQSAFAYDPMIDLGTLGGLESSANAISQQFGQVVGYATDIQERRRAFVWSAAGMRDLNSLIRPLIDADGDGAADDRLVLTEATDINEYGEIVGEGFIDIDADGVRDSNEIRRAFLLRPERTPENAAPTVTIVHPAGGEAFSASVDDPSTPLFPDGPTVVRIGALATDRDSGIAKVEFYVAGELVGAATNTSTGTGGGGAAGYYQIEWNAPANLTVATGVTITAVATDVLGRSSVSNAISITVTPIGQEVVIRDLGTLGGDTSEAYAINNRGQVVGRSQTPNGSFHPFQWSDATGMVDIGVLDAGSDRGEAFDINDFGYVVGRSLNATGAQRAVYWLAPGGIRQVNGGLAESVPGAAYGINNLDQMVGFGTTAYGAQLGWFWRNATEGSVALGTLGGFGSDAWSVNSFRRIAGRAQDAEGTFQAYRWDRGFPYGAMTNLDAVAAGVVSSEGRGINYNGDVAGWVEGSQPRRGFIWRENNQLIFLGPLTGDATAEAYSINDGIFQLGVGQLSAVGRSLSTPIGGVSTSRAVRWSVGNNRIDDLTSLLPPGTGYTSLVEARDINNAGVIVGTGINGGKRRAFIMREVETAARPINTPPTVAISSPVAEQVLSTLSSLTIAAVAADGDGTVTKVDFWLGGATTNDNLLIGTAATATEVDGVSYFSFRWNSVQPGRYYLIAVATDDQGSTTTSERVFVTVEQPSGNRQPSASLLAIGSASVQGGLARVSDAGRLTVSGTAADDVGVAKVDLYLQSTGGEPVLQATDSTVVGGAWSVQLPNSLVTGTYTLIAVATETVPSGTPSVGTSLPAVFYYNVSTENPIPAPSVTITSPANNTIVNSGSPVTFAVTVNQGEVQTVEFYVSSLSIDRSVLLGSAPFTGFTLIGTDDNAVDGFNLLWSNPNPGAYLVYAVGIDGSGRRGVSAAVQVNVQFGRLRIVSDASPDDGVVVVAEGDPWTYVLRTRVQDLVAGERIDVSVEDLDAGDGLDMGTLILQPFAGTTEADALQRTLRWPAAARPTSGPNATHVRFRVIVRLDDGDTATTNDPVDVQDVILLVAPAGFTGG